MINNVVLVSGVQHSDSVIHVSILFRILSPFRLLQKIEQSPLCCTVGPCWFSMLYMAVCTRSAPVSCIPTATVQTSGILLQDTSGNACVHSLSCRECSSSNILHSGEITNFQKNRYDLKKNYLNIVDL